MAAAGAVAVAAAAATTDDDVDDDDFRFLYAGPPGTATPLHHDVLLSASWSVNVSGCKLWVLTAPEGHDGEPEPGWGGGKGEGCGQSAAAAGGPHDAGDASAPCASGRAAAVRGGGLYDPHGALRTATLLTAVERRAVEAALGGRPVLAPLSGDYPPPSCGSESPPPPLWLALQGPGDLMFVPCGWHHEVHNLAPCGSGGDGRGSSSSGGGSNPRCCSTCHPCAAATTPSHDGPPPLPPPPLSQPPSAWAPAAATPASPLLQPPPTAPLVVSINHNWLCGASLERVWAFMARELAAVRCALGDLRADMGDAEWHAQCQLLLRANNSGFDLRRFGALVANRAAWLLAQLQRDGGAACDVAEAAWRHPGSACVLLRVADAPAAAPPRSVALAGLHAARRVLAALLRDEAVAAGAAAGELLLPPLCARELLVQLDAALALHSLSDDGGGDASHAARA